MDCDVVVIGAGLSGLVAAAELGAAGRSVVVVHGEPAAGLGGQAHWSFGGLFGVGTPEQRRLGVRDSAELALADWLGSAGFDRPEDHWPRRWAEAYVDFAAGEQRRWLHGLGVRWFPLVQWAERGGHLAPGHGNSVPRFHVTWGTGPGLLEPFVRAVAASPRVRLAFRHRVTELQSEGSGVTVSGSVLVAYDGPRGTPAPSEVSGEFSLRAGAVVVPAAGSAATWTWSAATGPRAGERRRSTWSPASRRTWTAPGWR